MAEDGFGQVEHAAVGGGGAEGVAAGHPPLNIDAAERGDLAQEEDINLAARIDELKAERSALRGKIAAMRAKADARRAASTPSSLVFAGSKNILVLHDRGSLRLVTDLIEEDDAFAAALVCRAFRDELFVRLPAISFMGQRCFPNCWKPSCHGSLTSECWHAVGERLRTRPVALAMDVKVILTPPCIFR